MNRGQSIARAGSLPVRWFYLITIFCLTLTGFGQMPIFKRYYIADIPGLGWLAEFFITHYIHYLGAILFLGFAAYMIIDYLLLKRKSRRMTATGYLRSALLAGILAAILIGTQSADAGQAAAAAVGNIGPGLGEVIGPEGTYASLSDVQKLGFAFTMILGRLEILSVLVLFAPNFYR